MSVVSIADLSRVGSDAIFSVGGTVYSTDKPNRRLRIIV